MSKRELKPCEYGVDTCMCCYCEKPCNNGLNCWECKREGKAMHNIYLCTGFAGIPPWERDKVARQAGIDKTIKRIEEEQKCDTN